MTFLVSFIFYFIPTIIAICRKHHSMYAIAAVNILLGWTVICWLWALIWSLANKGQNNNIVINNHNHVGRDN